MLRRLRHKKNVDGTNNNGANSCKGDEVVQVAHSTTQDDANDRELQAALPSKEDRELMLRAVILAADTIEANRPNGDPSYKQHLNHVLQEVMVPAACEALKLVDSRKKAYGDDLLFCLANAALLDPTLPLHDVFGCIVLLLSNIVLHYGSLGGYDARVRHVLKTACVHVLYEQQLSEIEDDEQKTNQMDDFDESAGVIFSKQYNNHASAEGSIAMATPLPLSPEQQLEMDVKRLNEIILNESSQDCEALSNCDDLGPDLSIDLDHVEQPAVAETEDNEHTKLIERQGHVRYIANRKFENIEKDIAARIFRALVTENEETKAVNDDENLQEGSDKKKTKRRRKRVVRGIQITSVGVVGGALFALTGGLAGPAILGAFASLGIMGSSSMATLALLTTFKAAAALFGLSGGGLAAYKMKKRTDGLSEFSIRRENIEQNIYPGATSAQIRRGIEASFPQLSSTICISGWLRDKSDYQRPWGIQPTDPPIQDEVELLKRFYTVHDSDLVETCALDIKQRRKRERKEFSWNIVWGELEEKYGKNPDHLLPFDISDADKVVLSKDEESSIHKLMEKVVFLSRDGKGVSNRSESDAEILGTHRTPSMENSSDGSDGGDDVAHVLDKMVLSERERAILENIIDSHNPRSGKISNDDDNLTDTNDALRQDGNTVTASTNAQDDSHNQRWFRRAPRKARKSEEEHGVAVGGNIYPLDPVHPSFVDSESSDKSVHRTASANIDDDNVQSTEPNQGGETQSSVTPDCCDALALNKSDCQKENSELVETATDEAKESQDTLVVWDWQGLYGGDLHTVTWESKCLLGLCHIVNKMATEVSFHSTRIAMQYSLVGAIVAASALPSALYAATKVIDDPYQIVILRADQAGKELAKCLLQSEERRPVTLVGFSFGARVIYSCLMELARQQERWKEKQARNDNNVVAEGTAILDDTDDEHYEYTREPGSIVEDVVFMGLPRIVDCAALTTCRQITGGRLINCYIKSDWLLSLMFAFRAGTRVCGTTPIDDVRGIENYNVSDFVKAHAKYSDAVPKILQFVNFAKPNPL